jgi:NOL1/NOP2/fmu family ribosome biogenesis protein
LEKCRRFYPHVAKGEGQFFALLKRDENGNDGRILYNDAAKELSKDEYKIAEEFLKKNLTKYDDIILKKVGENIVIFTTYHPIPKYGVFMSGTLLGEIKKNILFPSHNLFSSYGERFIRKINLTRNDKRTEEYLRGLEIENLENLPGGYCAVCYEGTSLGGGKIVDGRIKNHYPKGLRIVGTYTKLK